MELQTFVIKALLVVATITFLVWMLQPIGFWEYFVTVGFGSIYWIIFWSYLCFRYIAHKK